MRIFLLIAPDLSLLRKQVGRQILHRERRLRSGLRRRNKSRSKRGWPGRESRPPIRGLAPSTARDQNINEMELGKLPSRDVTPAVNRPAPCVRKNACAQWSKAVPFILDKRWREGLP